MDKTEKKNFCKKRISQRSAFLSVSKILQLELTMCTTNLLAIF